MCIFLFFSIYFEDHDVSGLATASDFVFKVVSFRQLMDVGNLLEGEIFNEQDCFIVFGANKILDLI